MPSIYGDKSSTGWQLRLDYSYTQDVTTNRSTITMDLYLYVATIPAYNLNANSAFYTLAGKKTYQTYNYTSKGWYKLGSDTMVVIHDSDGTKSTRLYGTWCSNVHSNYTPWSLSVDETVTLDTIPRASKLSCPAAYIGENANITITRASPSFTHTISYSFGSLTGTIATKTSDTSVSFPLPTTFYNQIPTAQSGWGTLTCNTYNGSTLIGTTTANFQAKCDEAKCKPTITRSAYDSNTTTIALTGSNQKFVKYFSNVTAKTNAVARNGATLVSQSITIGSKSIDSGSGTINNVESGSVVFKATDSRGFTSQITENHTLISYKKLTCAMEAGAASTSGVAQIKVSGAFYNDYFGAAQNTLTLQYRYKVQGSTYSDWTSVTDSITLNSDFTYNTTINISGLNYLNAYTFQVRAMDKLMTVESNEQTRKTQPIFDWGKDDFNINGDLTVNGDTIVNGDFAMSGDFTTGGSLNAASLSQELFKLIYPVGAIYISTSSTNPQTLFGGSWTQIKDRFLLAAGSSYSAGTTGGEATHKLTIDEMPAHSDSYRLKGGENTDSQTALLTWSANVSYQTWYTTDTGGNTAHNNMPPYLVVYVWKRTA